MPPPPPPARPRPAVGRPADGSSGAAARGEGGGTAGGGGSPYATGLGGKVRPVASYQLVPRGQQGPERHQQEREHQQQEKEQEPGQPVVEPMEVDPAGSSEGLAEAESALPLPRLGCACCGLSQHATEQCPLAMVRGDVWGCVATESRVLPPLLPICFCRHAALCCTATSTLTLTAQLQPQAAPPLRLPHPCLSARRSNVELPPSPQTPHPPPPHLPLQISPPSLVYAPTAATRRTLSLLLDVKPLANSASPEEHRWEAPEEPSPQLLSREQLLRCAGGSLGGGEGLRAGAAAAAAGSGSGAPAPVPAPAAAPAAASGAGPASGTDRQSGAKQEAPAGERVIGKDVQASCCFVRGMPLCFLRAKPLHTCSAV